MNSSTHILLLHLSPNDPEPLRDQIERQIRGRIARGELAASDALPTHRQLARRHRVAPSTVAAAYERLIADGLLTGSPETDVRVATLAPDRRQELVERQQLERLVAQELGRRELEMARDVQRRLLPPPDTAGPGWSVAARCQPARVVAGDFYDVIRRGDGSVDIVVADVAGKGFGASLIMASVKAMLPFVSTEGGVDDVLLRLNDRLAPELGRGEFVALAVARYHPASRQAEIASAGAPDPYLLSSARGADPLVVAGPRLPLGVRAEVAYESLTVRLEDDESLLLLTDGLPEARNETGDPLGYEKLEAMMSAESPGEDPSAWLGSLFDHVQHRSARAPEDDWTAALLIPQSSEADR